MALLKLKTIARLKKGQVLILTFVFLLLIVILSATLLEKTRYFLNFGLKSLQKDISLNLAEAGIDNVLWKLNTGQYQCNLPACTSGSYTFLLGPGKINVTVVPIDDFTKRIISEGQIIKDPRSIKIETEVAVVGPRLEASPFFQAAHVGAGGVVFGNNTTVPAETPEVIGDVKTTATSSLATSGRSIGVQTADGDSGKITGKARSRGSIDDEPPLIVTGTRTQSDPTVEALPSDADWLAKVADAAGTGNTCTSIGLSFADKTLGDPFDPNSCSKITGNVTISAGTLYIAGPVWIQGSLTLGTGGKMQVAPAKIASQLVRADGGISIAPSSSGIPLSPEGHFVGLMSTRLSSQGLAIGAGQYGLGMAAFVPQGSVEVSLSSAYPPVEGAVAVIADSLRVGWTGKIKWNSSLASTQTQFQTSSGADWSIIRGTYKISSVETPTLATKPIAHWKFDESTGTWASDSIGTITGSLVNSPVWTAGKYGNGLDFNGSNQYVDFGDPLALSLNRDFTITAWIKPDTAGSPRGIISHGQGEWYLRFNNASASNKLHFLESFVANILDSTITIPTATWTHVAVTVSSGTPATVTLYVNGTASGSTTTSTTLNDGTEKVTVGADRQGTSERFDGMIDDVRVYNKALNSAEITQAMNNVPYQ